MATGHGINRHSEVDHGRAVVIEGLDTAVNRMLIADQVFLLLSADLSADRALWKNIK